MSTIRSKIVVLRLRASNSTKYQMARGGWGEVRDGIRKKGVSRRVIFKSENYIAMRLWAPLERQIKTNIRAQLKEDLKHGQ